MDISDFSSRINYYESLLNSLPYAIINVDELGKIFYANIKAEMFFDLSQQKLLSLDMQGLFSPHCSFLKLFEKSQGKKHPIVAYDQWISTHFLTYSDPVNVTISPIFGTNAHQTISFEQSTLTHKINHKNHSVHTLNSMKTMFSMLAHEVKNPLSSIKGAAQFLSLSLSLSQENKELIELICCETNRIVSLLERTDVLSYPLDDLSFVNIHMVLKHVRELAEKGFGKNIEFIEDYDPSLPDVLGNKDQLIQVFLNLIKNACEAIDHEGGKITLMTRYKLGIKYRFSSQDHPKDLSLMVCVRDNGQGIDKKNVNRLFDPFFTTKFNGSGLGLSLVSKIIGDHKGFIEYNDCINGETEFKIFLPHHSA